MLGATYACRSVFPKKSRSAQSGLKPVLLGRESGKIERSAKKLAELGKLIQAIFGFGPCVELALCGRVLGASGPFLVGRQDHGQVSGSLIFRLPISRMSTGNTLSLWCCLAEQAPSLAAPIGKNRRLSLAHPTPQSYLAVPLRGEELDLAKLLKIS